MSIVMRMEMPKSCEGCWVPSNKCKWRNIAWYLKEKPNVGYRDIRNPFCPIICELPEGHGRLVDAKALFERVYEYYGQDNESNENWMMEMINGAHTIVPADTKEIIDGKRNNRRI